MTVEDFAFVLEIVQDDRLVRVRANIQVRGQKRVRNLVRGAVVECLLEPFPILFRNVGFEDR